ncbi:MAG: SGNH/GDSL hydrolase family protein [Elusimicrobia bacterium]|nr:SGNH/GDSL hydrolase family protein [Elusimicrobiota bacterium]
MRRDRLIHLWLALGVLACALLSAEIVLYANNTLERHPRWMSAKPYLAREVMGAAAALKTRNLTQRNRLNLHRWFGFNELLFNEPFAPGRIRLRFRLSAGSLDILFNKTAARFSAIRLSADPRFPNAHIQGETGGRFTSVNELAPATLALGWHRLELSFAGGRGEVWVDGKRLWEIDEAPLPLQVAGVRAGLVRTYVDDVEIADAGGKLLADETFRNADGRWRLAGFFAGVYGAAFAALLILLGRRGVARAPFWTGLAEGVLAASLLFYFAFDFYFWSSRYPYKEYVPWQAVKGLEFKTAEAARVRLFGFFAEPARAPSSTPAVEFLSLRRWPKVDITQLQIVDGTAAAPRLALAQDRPEDIERLAKAAPGKRRRLLLLGTSQTWGAGAGAPEETLGYRLFRSLATSERVPIEVINASLSGADAPRLFGRLKTLEALRPDVVVVNLSNNDGPGPRFKEALDDIAKWCEDRHARAVFVLEASHRDLARKHAVMRTAAGKAGVPCLDLNAYLFSPEVASSGHLWWDEVHLTSYGQELAAEFIADGLRDSAVLR